MIGRIGNTHKSVFDIYNNLARGVSESISTHSEVTHMPGG